MDGHIKMEDILSLTARDKGEWFAKILTQITPIEMNRISRDEITTESPLNILIQNRKEVPEVFEVGTLTLFNRRVLDVLKKSCFTGWKLYPVILQDKVGKVSEEYWGLSITGRAGKSLGGLEKRFPTTSLTKRPQTFFRFEIGNWDGSDFFMLSDMSFNLITPRVANAFIKYGLKDWKATSILNLFED